MNAIKSALMLSSSMLFMPAALAAPPANSTPVECSGVLTAGNSLVVTCSLPSGGGTPPPEAAAGFYVSAAGNDSNPGTRDSPFLTPKKCDEAMTASPDVKACYFLTSMTLAVWPIHSNEAWSGDPKLPLDQITITPTVNYNGCTACSNVSITGLTIDSGAVSGNSLLGFFDSKNVYIQSNVFNIHSATQAIITYNMDDLYIRGNVFNGSTTNRLNVTSNPINDHKSHQNIFITDNVFSGCDRMCVETQNQTEGDVNNFHVDRNHFSHFEGVHNACKLGDPVYMAASIVYFGKGTGNTFWGNIIDTDENANACIIGLEVVTGGLSVEENQFNFQSYITQVAGSPGTVFENNTYQLPVNNTVAHSPPINTFGDDGGYTIPVVFWIGENTINGQKVTGCQSGGGNAPGYCALSSGNAFPQKPPVYQPSPVFPGVGMSIMATVAARRQLTATPPPPAVTR